MKHIYQTIIAASIASMALPTTLSARQLSVSEAITAACQTESPAKAYGNRPIDLMYTATADGINTLYVVSTGEGFLIVSADDVATPLLGYSDSSEFDIDNIPPAMRQWLDGYSAQIAAAAQSEGSVSAAAPRASYTDIYPIMSTTWNQDSPYNDKCPKVDNKATYTGCVATALAQIMAVHKWPAKGSGTNTYEWKYYNSSNQLKSQNLTFNFSTIPLSWSSMIDSYSNNKGTAAQRTAVANLMYAAGGASNMQYGTGASSASIYNSAIGLINYFDYDKGLMYYERNLYPLSTWTNMLYTELAAGRPVLYAGQNANGQSGHAFVIDGYSAGDGLFHVNWGWGGMSDGYFQITTLDPGQQGIGGSSSGYSNDQSAVMGIRRPVSGSDYKTLFGVNGTFSTLKGTYDRATDETVTVNCQYRNYSFVTKTVDCGLKLVNKQTGKVSYVWWWYSPSALHSNYYFSPFKIYTSDFPTEGTFTVTPVVKDETGTISEMCIPVDSPQSMTLVATTSKLTFTADSQQAKLSATGPVSQSKLYAGKRYVITTTVSNTGAEYFGKVELRFKRGTTDVASIASGNIDIEDGKSLEVTFDATLPAAVTAGTYTIGIYDNTGKLISPTQSVTVGTAPSGTPKITFSNIKFLHTLGGSGTKSSPAIICADYFWIEATATCSGGYFDQKLYAYIFPESAGSSLTVLTDNTLPMTAGESRKVTFHGNIRDVVSVGSTYFTILSQPVSGSISGTWNYFKVGILTGIDDVTVDNGPLSVYPNPATEAVTIGAGAAVRAVSIYSLDGTLARRADFNGSESTVTLDVDALAAGHYIITVETVSGTTAERLIKR